jgi:hypothetical protein
MLNVFGLSIGETYIKDGLDDVLNAIDEIEG